MIYGLGTMLLGRFIRGYWRSLALTLLICAVFALVVLHTERTTQYTPETLVRYTYYGIPIALSELIYGRSRDYTGYYQVSWLFWGDPEANKKSINELITEASRIRDLRKDVLWFMGTEDKGIVDFVRLAFQIFGLRVESLLSMFFLVLGLSCLLYVVDNFGSPAHLILLLFLLLPLFVLLFVIPASDQFGSVLEPRFLEVLSLFSTLHILVILLDGRPPRFRTFLCCAGQIFIIVFVYHLRVSAVWQIGAIGVLGTTLAGGWFLKRRSRAGAANVPGARRLVGWLPPSTWALMLLVLGVGSLEFYKWNVYNSRYFTEYGANHVFWHSALMGLSVNRGLSEHYRIDPRSDESVAHAVERYLGTKSDAKTRSALFSDPNFATGNWVHFHWVLYEPAARGLYFDILRRHPILALRAYLLDKPQVLMSNAAWAAGFSFASQVLIPVGRVASLQERTARDWFYRPFRPEAVLILVIAVLIGYESVLCLTNVRRAVVLGVVVLAFSAMPAWTLIPVFQYIGVSLMAAAWLLYSVLSFSVLALGRVALSQLKWWRQVSSSSR